jgi:hypothetical protein
MLDMLALVTVIEPKITRDPSNLNLKSATLKTMKGLQQWIDVHVTQSPYHVIIGKYCQVAGAQKCAACKPVKMETAIWNKLSRRVPLLPNPEPSALPECKGEWASYNELVGRLTTSVEYQPAADEKAAKAADRAELKRERGRFWVGCVDCDKRRVIFSSTELCEPQFDRMQLWLEGINYSCGFDFRGAPGNGFAVRVNETLTCNKPMESAYYYANLSERGDYKLVCYHCGGDEDCRRDEEHQLKFSIVMPQCSQCRRKKVEPFCQRPVVNQAANVISERHRNAAEAQMAGDRAAERTNNPTPNRSDDGCDKVNCIVGARTSNDGAVDYLIHWAKLDGEEYPMDTCTWEPRDTPGVKETNLDSQFLIDSVVETTINC